MAQLAIVVKSTGIYFPTHCYEDRVVQSTGSLNYLLVRQTPYYFRSHFMASVLLPKLAIVVPPNTVDHSIWIIMCSHILSDNH